MCKVNKLIAVLAAIWFYSTTAQAQVVVVPLPGDDAPGIYTAQAPIVLTGINDSEITFDINQMPVVPLSKIPSGIPSSRLMRTSIMQPYQTLTCTIVTQGIYPSRNGSDDYIGQIVWGGWNFAPRGSTMCNGQLLAASSNEALFSLLGTTYGGDGRTTFGIPEMRGRVAVHAGRGPGLTNRQLGETGGAETIGQ